METAGLVIGSIGLAGLFETCMSAFNRIDDGLRCGQDYQEAALKLTLLGARLVHWEESYRTSAPSSTASDGQLAKTALESIIANLNRLAKSSERYEPQGRSNGRDDSNSLAGVGKKLRGLTISKKAKPSVGAKIVWSLRDKSIWEEVTKDIKFKIDALVGLAKSLVPATERLMEDKARKDAEELVQPSSIEEPAATIPMLSACAAEVDPNFEKAVRHRYKDVLAFDDAKILNGDSVGKGWSGQLPNSSHSYQNVQAKGNARVQNGDRIGMDKDFFD
ncbi:hypothetical protein Q7P37_005973 [Cladosporium fusiforme]